MSVADFFAASKILIVAGKGGVGKTTVGATIGLAAARAGLDTLVVELEGRASLAAPFDRPALGDEPMAVIGEDEAPGRLRAMRLTPDRALADYLSEHGVPLGSRLIKSSVIDLVATTAPGIRDLVTLGKIRQMAERGLADLIVVDAPAAGHAITFLRAAGGLAGSASSGPIRVQADLALEMLGDASRCRVMLVTLPEETPVNEVIETAFAIEDEVGVQLAPIVVNGVWPRIEGLLASGGESDRATAARYRVAREENQRREIDRLAEDLPLPRIELPFLFTTRIGRDGLDTLATALTDGVAEFGEER